MGYYYLNQWQPEEAEAAFRRSRVLHRQLENRSNAAMAQERLGQAYLIAGDFARAVAAKEAALQEFEALNDEWGIAWTLDELATCYQWTGQWELGLQATERAKQLFARWGGNRETECTARQGNLYLKQGRLDLALRAYQQAASMPEHGTWSNYHIHAGHGQIHLAQGEFEKARKRFEQAMQSFQERNKDNEAELTGNCNLGNLFMAQGQWEKATEHFSACLDMAKLMRCQAFRCLAQIRMAQAYYQQGYPERVEALVSEIEEVAKRYEYHQLLAEIYTLRGHVALDGSSPDSQKTVLQYYETALKHALHYNRYQLDETVKEIIAHCQNREAKGRQILTDLVQFWRTCTAQQAHSCLKAERAAREREPGDGSPQINVVERIKRAL
jgi:tetratricopeptide (TPR) repeat protein